MTDLIVGPTPPILTLVTPPPVPELETAAPPSLGLAAPRTQTQLRTWAFAKRICETVNVAEAYRDTFDPGEQISPRHHAAGAAMLKKEEVGLIVKAIAAPALVELGVDRNHAIKRLLEAADGDVTDYYDGDTMMSPSQMRAQLTPEKRRLIKKIKERILPTGEIQREIEMEGKHEALRLLAQIQQWVQPGSTTIVNNETIVTYLNIATKSAAELQKKARETAANSNSANQLAISASAQVVSTQVVAERVTATQVVSAAQVVSAPVPVLSAAANAVAERIVVEQADADLVVSTE